MTGNVEFLRFNEYGVSKKYKFKYDEKAEINTKKNRDVGKLAIQKPKAIERIFNKGAKNAARCIELASGAEHTEEELKAEKKSQINPECPALANPNYVHYE